MPDEYLPALGKQDGDRESGSGRRAGKAGSDRSREGNSATDDREQIRRAEETRRGNQRDAGTPEGPERNAGNSIHESGHDGAGGNSAAASGSCGIAAPDRPRKWGIRSVHN